MVFLISARSAKVPIGAKLSNRMMQVPVKKVMPLQEDARRKVKGSIPVPAKEISSLVHLEDHLILKIIHYNSVSCIMY